jgi:ABC-type transport system substrate-binding protein/DNA repair ATPase RecN
MGVEEREIERTKGAKRTRDEMSLLGRVAMALAAGDLTADIALDLESARLRAGERLALMELIALARRIRRMVNNLQQAAESIEDVATRVLEGGRQLAAAVSDEAASVDSTVSAITQISASAASIAEAVNALSHLAQTTSTSILEMAASIDEASANSDALASFVEETASSIEEMAASVRNVATATESLAQATDEAERSMRAIDDSTQRVDQAAGEAAALAEEVQRSAEQGSAVVIETAESMRTTRRSVEETAETIAALGAASERIGAITRVIDEIADRTNLLALNARILAAQAGPQGRGFAVVAEEIKELSERTARSTEEINQLIKGVRESVAVAMAQADANRQLADQGLRLAERAARSLNEISRLTAESARAIRQIAEAAGTQAVESRQVTELVAKVRRRAQEIERATSEQAATAQQIGQRATQMALLTGQVQRAMQEQADSSKQVAQAMERLTELIDQIGYAADEQHRGTEDILRAMEVIHESVRNNQASIVQINYTSSLLGYEANSLRAAVKQFRVPTPRRGGHLRYGLQAPIPSLDVLEATTLARADLLSLMLECLVETGKNAEVKPVLAESWRIAANGRVYVFNLRRGVRFHNGRVMTAHDVVYSIQRTLRHSRVGSLIFMNLVGAPEYARGETDELIGARALDDWTVELELTEPLAFFLQTLCRRFAAIVPREEIEEDGGARFARHPIGTGPFRLLSYDAETGRVELERFDLYWRETEPYVDRVTVQYNESGETLIERLKRGELDFVRESSAQRLARLAEDAQWRSGISVGAQLHTQFLAFDAEQPPFNDVRVRRAIAHAIDRERFVRESYGEMAVPAVGPIPPGLIGHDAGWSGIPYDPKLARKLLAEAGYRSGLKVELWRSVAEQSICERAGQFICESLAAIGIEARVRVAEIAEIINAALEGRAQFIEVSWYADYADPDNFTYLLFHSANRHSSVGRMARVPEVDELSERARCTISYAERAQIYARLQRLIAEEALAVFLAHRHMAVVQQPYVEGLELHLVAPAIRPQKIWLARKSSGPA